MEAAHDRDRLLGLVDDGPLDEQAELIRRLLGCDTTLVTVLDDDAQRFLGQAGRIGTTSARRGTPLDRSLCARVAAQDGALRLDHLAADEEYRDHLARTDLGIEAYLGVPLRAPDGDVVGAVCGIQEEEYTWSDRDLELLRAMRDLVQVELRQLLGRSHDRQRVEETSLLLSTLRHELGGQLAIVLGGIETALVPQIAEDLRVRVLQNAQRDCRRVVSTLDALLRLDSRAPVQLREVDLPSLLREVVTSTATGGDAARVELDAGPCTVVLEPTLLAHVVRNLVENACKYSRGDVRVTGECSRRGVRITVSDDGPGIPDAVTAQLFRPFSRSREDGGASGFGLGMYIIRRLCDRLGANLAVDTGDHGTSITVEVPDARQSPKPSKAASSSEGA